MSALPPPRDPGRCNECGGAQARFIDYCLPGRICQRCMCMTGLASHGPWMSEEPAAEALAIWVHDGSYWAALPEYLLTGLLRLIFGPGRGDADR